jgi:hypothetical protein
MVSISPGAVNRKKHKFCHAPPPQSRPAKVRPRARKQRTRGPRPPRPQDESPEGWSRPQVLLSWVPGASSREPRADTPQRSGTSRTVARDGKRSPGALRHPGRPPEPPARPRHSRAQSPPQPIQNTDFSSPSPSPTGEVAPDRCREGARLARRRPSPRTPRGQARQVWRGQRSPKPPGRPGPAYSHPHARLQGGAEPCPTLHKCSPFAALPAGSRLAANTSNRGGGTAWTGAHRRGRIQETADGYQLQTPRPSGDFAAPRRRSPRGAQYASQLARTSPPSRSPPACLRAPRGRERAPRSANPNRVRSSPLWKPGGGEHWNNRRGRERADGSLRHTPGRPPRVRLSARRRAFYNSLK